MQKRYCTGTRTGGFYNWGSKSTGREGCTEDHRTGRSQSRRFCETPTSSSDMRKRKAVLEAKQEVIREVLEDAYKAVGELDDAAYFAMLEKVLEKYVLPEAGTICFTEKDRKRMPQGIWKKYMKQRRRKAEAWNLQRQCRKEWMGIYPDLWRHRRKLYDQSVV